MEPLTCRAHSAGLPLGLVPGWAQLSRSYWCLAQGSLAACLPHPGYLPCAGAAQVMSWLHVDCAPRMGGQFPAALWRGRVSQVSKSRVGGCLSRMGQEHPVSVQGLGWMSARPLPACSSSVKKPGSVGAASWVGWAHWLGPYGMAGCAAAAAPGAADARGGDFLLELCRERPQAKGGDWNPLAEVVPPE